LTFLPQISKILSKIGASSHALRNSGQDEALTGGKKNEAGSYLNGRIDLYWINERRWYCTGEGEA
jgi:hypothetical protein